MNEETASQPIEIPTIESTTMTSHVLNDLTVKLSVELSKKYLSLKEIGSLRPAQIIELNKRPGDLVDLVVGDKKIGQGELVDVDGELGVRIVSLEN